MFKVTVLYPRTTENDFNLAYYLEIHTPMIKELLGPWGLVKVDVEVGIAGPAPGSDPAYAVICGIYFSELHALQDGLDAEGATLIADIPNFTNEMPTMQISRVE